MVQVLLRNRSAARPGYHACQEMSAAHLERIHRGRFQVGEQVVGLADAIAVRDVDEPGRQVVGAGRQPRVRRHKVADEVADLFGRRRPAQRERIGCWALRLPTKTHSKGVHWLISNLDKQNTTRSR